MTEGKNVLLVGWSPDAVDFSKWPGLTADALRAGLEASKASLNSLGYAAEWCFIDDADSAAAALTEALTLADYRCVLIGAGVRRDPEHLPLFERLVNAVHQAAPTARICFNTQPSDTAAAVQRWI